MRLSVDLFMNRPPVLGMLNLRRMGLLYTHIYIGIYIHIHMLISVPCVEYQPVDCMSPSDRFEPSQGLWISRVEKPAVALQAKSYPGLGFCHW